MKRWIFIILLLFILLTELGAARVIPIPQHFKPFRIRVLGERIYISQGPEIFIYREKDMKLLHKFGKAGEGPKEFKLFPEESPDLDILRDQIIVTSLDKVTFFSAGGKFQREFRLIEGGRRQFFRLAGDKLLAEHRARGKNVLYRALSLYDMAGEKIKEIFRYKHFARRGKQYNPINRGVYLPNLYVAEGNIFLGGALYSGLLHVFDIHGKPLYTIKPGLEKVPFTKKDKQGWIDSFMSNSEYQKIYERIKHRFKYPNNFPFWQDFVVTGGKIYIQTYKRDKKDRSNECYILTLKGKLIKRVWLPLAENFDFSPSPYTIHNGKLYQVLDNEDKEEWELHITKIDR
jgi:hypothetical protein